MPNGPRRTHRPGESQSLIMSVFRQDRIIYGVFPYRGTLYTGAWSETNARPQGHGTISDLEVDQRRTYTGEWKDGKRDGWGTEFYEKGANYYGQWRQDKKHGWGIMTYRPETSRQVRFIGRYDQDKKSEGELSSRTHSGDVIASYRGKFVGDEFHDTCATVVIGQDTKTRWYVNGTWQNGDLFGRRELDTLLERFI